MAYIAPVPQQWHKVIEATGALTLVWLVLYFLYRKKSFLLGLMTIS